MAKLTSDAAEFIDQHPGGEKILAGMAGRDATELFEKYHPGNPKELLDSVRSLKVGRMVRAYSPESPLEENETSPELPLEENETRLLDRVFDISSLEGLPEWETLFACCGGEDASNYLGESEEDDPDPWAARLWNEKQHLVVGKVATPEEQLPSMTREQLAQHDGGSVDRHTEKACFVAVDDVVMDVTTLMRYGPKAVTEKLKPHIGRVVTDGDVDSLLREQYGFRAVARLTENKTADVEWDPCRLRDLGADQLQALVRELKAKEPEPGKGSKGIGLPRKADAVDLTDVGKEIADKVARDSRYPVPTRVDQTTGKRKREAGEPVPTCAEMTRELRETARRAVEALKKDMMMKGDLASGLWAEEMERDRFETRAGGPRRVRV